MISFQETNKNYIYQVLVVGMRNLSDNQKRDRYNTGQIGNIPIKNEIRLRLKEYYFNECKEKDKEIFYKDVIDLIGFYEFDYILINLLNESNNINIINYLFLNSCFEIFEVDDINCLTYKTFESIKLILNNKKIYSKVELEKHLFSRLNEIINSKESGFTIKNDSTFLKEYPKWLINNLSSDKSIPSFIYFSFIWQMLELKNNNTQVILLYHYFIEQIKLNIPIGLDNFVKKINSFFDALFTVQNICRLLKISTKLD